jgi:hypothetical protein
MIFLAWMQDDFTHLLNSAKWMYRNFGRGVAKQLASHGLVRPAIGVYKLTGMSESGARLQAAKSCQRRSPAATAYLYELEGCLDWAAQHYERAGNENGTARVRRKLELRELEKLKQEAVQRSMTQYE